MADLSTTIRVDLREINTQADANRLVRQALGDWCDAITAEHGPTAVTFHVEASGDPFHVVVLASAVPLGGA